MTISSVPIDFDKVLHPDLAFNRHLDAIEQLDLGCVDSVSYSRWVGNEGFAFNVDTELYGYIEFDNPQNDIVPLIETNELPVFTFCLWREKEFERSYTYAFVVEEGQHKPYLYYLDSNYAYLFDINDSTYTIFELYELAQIRSCIEYSSNHYQNGMSILKKIIDSSARKDKQTCHSLGGVRRIFSRIKSGGFRDELLEKEDIQALVEYLDVLQMSN